MCPFILIPMSNVPFQHLYQFQTRFGRIKERTDQHNILKCTRNQLHIERKFRPALEITMIECAELLIQFVQGLYKYL